MTRRLLFLIAPVLASVSLVAGPLVAPAHADTSSPPLTCVIGLAGHAVCVTLS